MSVQIQFIKDMKKSKTFRIAVKKCLKASSSTSVFLYSLIETLFSESNTKLFRNISWSNVSKSPEFQTWVENFINESAKFRENQIEEFSKLKKVLSENLRNEQEFTKIDMKELGAEVLERATNPKKVVTCLRSLADSISELEEIQNDKFKTKRLERKFTNLQNRIEELQSNFFFLKIFL